jgi:lysine N6-hydroxylase
VRWHPGLQLPESELQVSFLKDLVTLVDPTSRYTFLNFLAKTGRLHRFAVMPNTSISRAEFEAYYAWAAGLIDSVALDVAVNDVSFDGTSFVVRTSAGIAHARNLCIGTGAVPSVPHCVRGLLGATMLHASDFLHHPGVTDGRRVAVIGGGQSGAEIVAHLLDRSGTAAPTSLAWLSRRANFLPMDDSAFTNEWFQPDYVRYFRGLPAARRRELLDLQQLSSDGVSMELLHRIYRQLYLNDFVAQERIEHTLLPGVDLLRADETWGGWRLQVRHLDTGAVAVLDADVVILATGYRYQVPECLAPLGIELPTAGRNGLPLCPDYSLPWSHAATNGLYFMNAGRHSHGIADPNLSLASWRAAVVANAIAGTDIYSLASSRSACRWQPSFAQRPRADARAAPPRELDTLLVEQPDRGR